MRSRRSLFHMVIFLGGALFTLGTLASCDVSTPGFPEATPKEWAREIRLAAQGDPDALRRIVRNASVSNDSYKMMKWADRLSLRGVPEGFDLSASSRADIASRLPLDDPERLLLLVEAREYGAKAAAADPKQYGRMSKTSDWLGNDVRQSEAALEREFGPLIPLESQERPSRWVKE